MFGGPTTGFSIEHIYPTMKALLKRRANRDLVQAAFQPLSSNHVQFSGMRLAAHSYVNKRAHSQ